MRLTFSTDYALRLLMLVGLETDRLVTIEEVAEMQGISERTVKRNWAYARAWLGRELAAYDQPNR